MPRRFSTKSSEGIDLVIGADLLGCPPEEFGRKREEEGIVNIAVEDRVVLEPSAWAGRT